MQDPQSWVLWHFPLCLYCSVCKPSLLLDEAVLIACMRHVISSLSLCFCSPPTSPYTPTSPTCLPYLAHPSHLAYPSHFTHPAHLTHWYYLTHLSHLTHPLYLTHLHSVTHPPNFTHLPCLTALWNRELCPCQSCAEAVRGLHVCPQGSKLRWQT